MEKYLGIYNDSACCTTERYNLDNDVDLDNLYNAEYEYANTIEELENLDTEAGCLHIYELQDNGIYTYLTTKGIK